MIIIVDITIMNVAWMENVRTNYFQDVDIVVEIVPFISFPIG
jgi:hypothetical protein